MIVAREAVLCAISGAERDVVLIEVAGALARRTRRSLNVLHVQPPIAVTAAGASALANPPPAREGDEIDALRRRLVALAAEAGQDDAVCEVVEGGPRMVLQDRSHRTTIAWLVLGDPGSGALRSAMEGTVSRHLLIDAGCPLMLVPPEADAGGIEDPRTIVCAVAGDAGVAAAATAVAGALARDLGASLTVVHAVDHDTGPHDPSERAGEVERLLDRCLAMTPVEVDARPVAVAGDPTEALLEVAAEEAPGIVVMGCPSHGPLRSAIGRSVPHGLLEHMDRRLAVVVPDAAAAGIRERATIAP